MSTADNSNPEMRKGPGANRARKSYERWVIHTPSNSCNSVIALAALRPRLELAAEAGGIASAAIMAGSAAIVVRCSQSSTRSNGSSGAGGHDGLTFHRSRTAGQVSRLMD